ncbi:MAG: hypothetical protein HOL85_17690 [Rhodospirillaceae bacterium]|jgi:hypothetical protein|nr:hypothetical protein [Rhodospirillaceae bacterium]
MYMSIHKSILGITAAAAISLAAGAAQAGSDCYGYSHTTTTAQSTPAQSTPVASAKEDAVAKVVKQFGAKKIELPATTKVEGDKLAKATKK